MNAGIAIVASFGQAVRHFREQKLGRRNDWPQPQT